jgi:ABC-2 type transport system permease protein
MSLYVLWRMIVKEFLQLLRDRKILRMVFLAPAFQILALGYAANLDVNDIPLLLVDRDGTMASRQLVDRFTSSGYFRLVGRESALTAVDSWLETGRAQVVLVIDQGYGEAVATAETPRVQVLGDGTDSIAAGIGLSYASQIVGQESVRLLGAQAAASGRTVGSVEMVPRIFYNPDLRSRWFYVPALLAMILMVMTLVLSSMGVVREKEVGTMEQLMVTPLRSWQIIIGKLFPFAVIGLIDVVIVTALVVFWFRVPLRGSFLLLIGLTMVLVLNNLGLGLLVSTIARTQQQAMMGAAFVLMLPQIYLSGLIFPIENMPAAIQKVTYLIPLRYFTTILRGIFLKGSGLDVLWPQALALALFAALFLTLASLRFRKRLD